MVQKITRTVEIIEHKGVRILVSDYSGLSGQDIADTINENIRAMASKVIPGKKDGLSLNIFTDCFFDDAALKALSRVAETMKPFFIATAEVGMSEVQKAGVDIAARKAKDEMPHRFFDNVDEAKDWLVSMYSKHVSKGKNNVSRPIEW